jgi:hypothetical protein
MGEIRYPNITVQLVGEDGDSLSILARVQRAMHRAGIDDVVIKEFQNEAISGDYNHLLQTCMKWVDVE